MMTRFTEGASAFGRSAWMRVVVGVLFLIPLHFMGLTEDASAQPPAQVAQGGAQDDVVDPPARVGRLSFISGTVSFRTLDTDQWQAAVPNYPVTTGLSFWTEPRSRATLQLGHGVLRMDGSTEIDVQQFDDEVIQISILQGSINFRLRSIAPDETYQILTPTGWVELNAPGRYRIDATTDGTPARLSVFEGSADVIGDNTRITVNRGQARPVELVPSPPTRVVAAEIDDFADQQEAAFARVPDYVSPDMPGIQDIVSIGAWESVPRYGRVWYPPVEAGWAPYRYGHWHLWRHGAGPGSTRRPGASHHSTTGAGSRSGLAGPGFPAVSQRRRSMPRRWWLSLAVRASGSAWASAADRWSGGSRSRPLKSSCHPIPRASTTFATSTSRM